MKILLSLIIVIALAGGGYWYTQNNASPATSSDSFGMTADESGMDAMDADHSGDTNPAVTPTNPTPATGDTHSVTPGATVSTGMVKTFTVTGKNFSFAPATMIVKKGDTVRITFVNDSGTHDLVVDGYNARTKIIQGGAQETIEFVADKAGTFEYYCSVGKHREMGMKGTLTVQ